MGWERHFDERSWVYDLSEARLPLDERPSRVTMRAYDKRTGAETIIITNRHLEGLFWSDGSQEAGTTQFSLRNSSDEEIRALLRSRLAACMMPRIRDIAEAYDRTAFDAVVEAWVAETSKAEELELGEAIDHEVYLRRVSAADVRRDDAICELAARALGE